MTVSKTIDHIQIKINIPNTSQEHPASFTSPNQDFVLAPKLSRQRGKILNYGALKTNAHIQIKIKIPYPVRNLQHPPKPQFRNQRTWIFFAPSKSRLRAKILNMIVSNTIDHILIKIKMPGPSQETPASSTAQNQDMDVLCTLKLKIESKSRLWLYQRPVTTSKSRSRCKP